jgi:hypothetical protein
MLLLLFSILAVTPFVIAATKASFWQPQHSMTPVATALYLIVVLALVLGRFRWAWILLTLFYGIADLSSVVHPPHTLRAYLLGLLLGVATFVVLVSSPMRDRLRRPVRLRHRTLQALTAKALAAYAVFAGAPNVAR